MDACRRNYYYGDILMKRLLIVLACLGATELFIAKTPLHAGLSLGAHVGYNTDIKSTFAGANGWLSFGALGISLILNPEIHFYPDTPGDLGYFEADGNILLGLGDPTGTIVPFGGLGVNLLHSSSDATGSITDYGVNISGGLMLQLLGIRPFAQGTFTMGDESRFRVQAGVALGL
jgi:hypothetical protein